MASFPTRYQDVLKSHPAAVEEALKRLRNSRSKFKDADPASLPWAWDVAIVVGRGIQPTVPELAMLDPQEYVKQAMTNEMIVYLCVQHHMYHSHRVLGTAPPEIVQEVERRNRPAPWNGATVHVFYPGSARPGIHELRVHSGMVPVKQPDRPRLVLADREGKPRSLLLAKAQEGFMGTNGGCDARLKRALSQSLPGDVFSWDRTQWRRMDLHEIRALTDSRPFWKTGISMDTGNGVFSMSEYGSPQYIPLDTPVYPLDALQIQGLPPKETLGERIHRYNEMESSPCL